MNQVKSHATRCSIALDHKIMSHELDPNNQWIIPIVVDKAGEASSHTNAIKGNLETN